MQDKKLLGDELSPKSTINASTDMSQSAFLPKGFQFEAPKAPQRNYDVTLGDTAKAVGSGALRSLAGLGELSENFLGVGEGFRDLMSSGSDSLQESMTQDGRDALNSRIFEENENGNPTFAEGAADIDVWAMKIADGLGSLAANFAGGGFAGAGAKVALRSTITKSMLKKGMTEKAAQAVADKAISRMAATGAGATGVGTSLGGASMDARDAVMQMDSSWLADNSEYFQQSLLRLADDPQYQGMSATELFDLAKEETASYASLQMSTDPTAVAASVAGAMGDKYLFGALLGKMGKKGIVASAAKGAITEGGTEFIEGYGQTYARNQVINEVTGQEIDPTTGALVDGLEGAVIGGALGGPLGAVGGYRAKGQPTENTPAQTNPQNVSDTQEQEIAEQAAEDAQVMPNNGDAPAQTAAMNADEPVLNPQGQYDELLQGAQQRQADNGRDAAIRSRFAQSRQALTERGVLPERNAYQETIEMARAVDPTRAAEIEQFLKSEEADQNPELTAQLEREYESLAQKGRDLDIDPTLTQIEHRQNQNRLDMAKREKSHQRIERKQNEYQLDDTISSRKAAIRAEMEPQLLKEDRNKPELLERMVELEYARRYPQPDKAKATADQGNGLEQFKSARFDRDKAQAAIEAKAQESKNAAQLAAAQRERDSRPASPDENPAWFGVHPESGEHTTRAFMRDLANQKGQAQASERQIDLDARRERLGQPVSSFMERPNSMKMREQGKKPIRDFAGIAGKTSRMSKRLRKRLSRAKGFDTDAVLAEFQNHEKRLAAYEKAARRRADYEANLPENIERRKNAEALFKEFVSDTEARTFAENEITQTIKRINALVDASPQGSVLELDGQTSSLPVIKKQMAHSVRNLANQFVGKTAAMMNAAALKKEASTQSVGSLDEPNIIRQAKAVIREVIDNNGGAKPKLKGVREAYRDKGFTAKALQEALGEKSLADFEREQKESYTERLSALSEPSIHSGQEVPLQSKGDIDHGNETSNTARFDERSSPQSEVQENEQRGTDANRPSVSEEDASAGRRANESRRTLPDSTERSVSRDAIERLALDEVDNLANGTATQRIAANIAAIRLMKDLTQSGMPATLEQKKVLAQYVGWGGLASVFDNTNTSKAQQAAHQELKTLLTEEEYNNVRMSTRNAFYTSEAVVKGMWSGVKALGLGNSPMNVVEPSLGSGNFIGWQPSDMRDQSRWFASELDPVTGNIAKLIYPEADVQVKGFQETPFKHGVFSLAIGNPPFGSQSIRDNKNPDISGMAIHNYFIAKSSKLLHENGLLMMVVTNRFLDTLNKNHKQLSQELDFVGAVRLPNTAFKSNAGTEVTTDIVVFRKLKQGETAKNTVWTDVDGEVNGFRVNQWFAQNPQYILGEVVQGKMYRGDESESTVNPVSQHANLEPSISKALASLAQGQDLALTPETKDAIAGEVMLAESDLAIGGMMVNADGKVMRRGVDHPTNGAQVYEVTPDSIWSDDGWLMSRARHFVEQGDKARLQQFADNEFLNKGKIKSDFTSSKLKESAVKAALAYLTGHQSKNQALSALDDAIDNTRLGPNKFRKLKAMLTIRNSALALLRAEKTGAGDIERLRQRLNVQYDEFAKAFATKGKNSKPATLTESLNLLDGDTGIEAGLDSVSDSGEVTKSDLFSKRLLFPYKRPESASNVSDAVNYSMRERGKVDIEYVSGLLGLGHDEVLAKLTEGEKPYLLMNPETQKYEFIDDYLSGNVKAKYQAAKSAGLDTNVKLLEAVLPEDKTPEQVKPSIRATWIDSDVFERFAEALGYKAKVTVNRHIGAISVLGEAGGTLSALGSQFKHDRATLADLLNSAANGKSLVIYDTNGKERTKNEKATKEVNALANKLASTFVTWAKSDAQIAKQIADNFNERINTHVNRKYNGRLYLQTVGMNPAVDMRKTQLDGALRMIQSKNTLLDHTVGAGKTFTAITGMMERKRLGLSKKPMAVVPNHILGSFHKDILKLYPSAKVLVADDKAFTAKKRKQFFSRIATGDYDVVLMGHSHLRAMPNDIEHFRTVINEKIDELRSALEEAKAEAKQSGQRGATVKQIEDSISRLQDKIKEKEEALSKNADQIGFSFGDLGVDYLVVDEAHEFKNLTYATRTDRVVGMNDPKGSEKALDLLIKTRSIQGLENGGVTFMTGTPISNSLVEVYTMMYYLGHDTLKELKMSFYDAFAGSFFNTEITLEYTPTGTVKERSVLKGLNNMQQLSTLYRQFADVITQKDMVNIFRQDVEAKNKATGENKATRFPIPNIKGGKRQLNIAPATEAQREYNDYLIARMEAFNQLKTKEERIAYAKIDNPLWVLTDAKKASLDVRLVDPTAQRDPTGKVARAAERIKSIYDQWQDDKGTQLVFSDMGTPAKYAIATVKSDLKSLAETVLGKGKAAAFISSRLEIYEGEMPYSQTLKELVDKVNAQAETGEIDADQYEKLEEQIRELTASTMTADTGFSVYDDLKASLMEKGIPDDEIAFIHDYNTTLKKEALFDRVRRGEVRVLIGSSMKMGAGTNVQNRLVALHHMDAPWRPSDMEQREGRIVRQGNEFYQRAANAGKPEDFEVELIAYTTQGSSDPVMWQILERKAGAIEQFRNGELDQFVENSNSDADSYAEFKAASTGNPIYRLKLESDAKLLDLDSSYTAQASSIGAAKRFVERFDDEKAAIELRLETLRQADITEFDAQAFTELYRDAQADYLAADNEYDAAMAIYSELDAKTRKERGLKKPQKPKRPMIHELDDEYSIELNKAIIQPAIAAIEQSRRWQGEIKLGKQLGLVMDVDYLTHEGTKTPLIDVRLVDGKGKTIDYMARGMQSSSIVQSPKLMNALHLNAIATALNGEQERFERKLQSLQSTLKDSRQIAKMDITALKQELDEAKSRNLWLSVEASMADIKEELRRSETPNKFVDRETLRKVKRSTFDPNSIRPETVEHNGQRYQTVGVRIPYPGWQYDSVMPALDANGDYVHLLLSHNSKVGEAPVLSEVIPQPTQTPKAEYAFLAEAKARHEARQIEEAKREIGSPVDEPSRDSGASDGVVLFSRTSTNAGRTGVKTGKIAGGITMKRSTIDAVTRTALGKLGLKDFMLRFETVDTEADLPDYVKTAIAKNDARGEVYGLYDTKEHKVWLVAEKHNYASEVEETIFHEVAGHVGLARLLKEGKAQPDMNTLALRLGGIKGIQRLAEKNGVDLAPYLNSAQTLTKADAEEILVQELVAHLAEQQKFATPIQRLLAKVRGMLRSLFGFIYSPEFNNNELLTLVFKAKEQLKAPPPKDKVTRPENNTLFFSRSRSQGVPADTASTSNQMSADEALAQKQNAWVSKIKQALYGAPVIGQSLDALGRNKYAMLTLRQMGEVSSVIDKPLGKMIDAYQDEINSMVVTQNMLAEEAAKMAEDLSDWAKANQKEADELFAFAHEATLADVDPSEAFQSREEDLKESIAKQERILKEEGGLNSERGSKAWKTLQEERELLKQEPNRRKRHVELRPKFARLNAEQKRRYRQMRDHYRAQSERMNKALEENIVRAVFDAKIRKAMLAELRQRHERAAKGLYFPLSRHGDYWIDFADENGERQFMMFETKGEMELAAEKLRKAGFSLNSGMKAQFNAVQKASLPFVADVLQLVEKANMHTPAKESLSDEIYQMYLRTLPARSMRRNFIHRKGVAGFSQDAVRALADQGFRQSRQQARLDHMDILDNHLDSIQKYVHELPNNVEADRVVEELNKRHEWVRNPSRAGWAQKLTSLGFVWMLGLTPAAALVNLTQNLQVALPILGSRYGIAESSKMMSQATAQYLKAAFTRNRPKGQGILGSVLTGGEKEAMRRAVAQGVIDVTQAADLAGLAENPNAKYSGTWNKAMNIIGWAFHHAEVFNREVTYIAAYRLAMKKHGDHEKAIADAIKDTWDSHFDYSSINRARFMQSDMAAVALQFKQYSQNMTYYLWANLAKALKGETPEVKSMARKQLLGTLASTFFIGGAGALPLWAISTAIEAAQEIVGDDDEPFDAETELKRMLAEAFGKENAALIWHGALPSISGRISLNDLWVRSINRDVDASTAYVEYMKQALGPVIGGIGVSWAQGLADISNDQFARGIERIPPKAIKDVLKTARYINEGGVTTKNGDEIVSDLTAFELLGQASGFAIGRANLQYDENNAIKNYETFIVKRRQSLMNAYYTAYRLKDGEAMKSVMVKIRKFNQSQYGKRNPITTESLRQSLKVRARKRSITQNGVQVNPKMNSLVMQYDYF
ncbi:PLxRFG domain-containing protein [Vibrio cholerae]|uniref:PLxRFG domain-containing protein n=1 Tax=Vibrio cholerae TaxID=666 RepID=UPI001C930A87|nr:PLxRFG domain-containing protein [Vibrio cholerae]MBY4642941.1 PLxRFG domain-containing protein [Vibrio cholerae]MCR9660873.1 PLxRFG domain-containing protein [Vibrio cholerae]MCR9689736.1 PLxRFG domain-containing protein [Vibrio cholerae]MCR9739958.1 PLxRFG domain-containing protein [Vibrio cholerae]MCR9748242.1 PLxRFG domain-containing protein [Vibrio cholerae]